MTEETKLTVNIEMGHGTERLGAGVQIRFHMAWSAISKNPLEVWRALALCDEFDTPAPAWASEYLARVTSAIATVEPSARFALKLREAMEFIGEAPDKHMKLMRQRKVVRWIFEQATTDEMADKSAMQRHFENAAIEFAPLDERTVATWWRDFHSLFLFE